MSKDEWTQKVYEYLCKRLGPPRDVFEHIHLRDWAEGIAEGDYFEEGISPEEAVEEEFSYC
jgi:hypothetical protein